MRQDCGIKLLVGPALLVLMLGNLCDAQQDGGPSRPSTEAPDAPLFQPDAPLFQPEAPLFDQARPTDRPAPEMTPPQTRPGTPSDDPNAPDSDGETPELPDQPLAANLQPTPPAPTPPELASEQPYERISSMPYMLGDLLRANRSVAFPYNLAGDIAGTEANGALQVRSPKVAENNTAIPRQRVSFRYHWFSNSAKVTGLEPFGDPVFPGVVAAADVGLSGLPPGVSLPPGAVFDSPDPNLGQFRFAIPGDQLADLNAIFPPGDLGQFGIRFDPGSNSQGTAVIFQDSFFDDNDEQQFVFDLVRILRNQEIRAAEREIDTHLVNFGWETTFLDGRASLEVRVPFAETVNSDLDLNASRVVNDPFTRAFLVSPAGGTLGTVDSELKDLQLIFKMLNWTDGRWFVSSGLGATLPTAEDANISIVDGFPDPTLRVFSNGVAPLADVLRTRDVRVKNETVALSPFVAVAAAPTSRLFFNGFLQFDFPIGQDTVEYNQSNFARQVIVDVENGIYRDPFETHISTGGKIRDQILMHLDLGMGYWLYQNPRGRRITGLASLFELHWTSTLQDADVYSVQSTFLGEPVLLANRDPNPAVPQPVLIEDPLRVGNLANRMDILNATFGGVITLSNDSSLSVGCSLPLQKGFDRVFDVELMLHFNQLL